MSADPQAQASDFSRGLWPVLLVVAALLAASLVLFATAPCGPGTPPDSVVYIDSARQIAAGNGPVATSASGDLEVVATWPPLYPTLIAVGIGLGLDGIQSARWLNALAHGAACALIGLLAFRVSGRRAAGVFAAWLAALSPSLLHYAGFALSEAVFLLLMAAALLAVLQPGRKWVVAAGALVGLACMQRYAGYGLAVGMLAWLLLRPGPDRVLLAALFALAAAPLSLAWRVYLWFSPSGLDARSLTPGLPTWHHVKSLAHSLSTWVIPETSPVALRAVAAGLVLLAVGAAIVWAIRKRNKAPQALLLVTAGAGLSLVLGATVLFLDRELQPEPRMVLPLLPLILVAAGWCVAAQGGRKRLVACALACLLAAGYGARDFGKIEQLRAGGGYAAPQYRDSPTMRAALELPPAPIYASNPQPLILHGRIPARALPLDGTMEYLLPAGTSPWPDMAAARRDVREILADGGYVVWFRRDGQYDMLKNELALETLAVYEDGEVLVSSLRK